MQNKILEDMYGDRIFDIDFVTFFHVIDHNGYENGITCTDEGRDKYFELMNKDDFELTKDETYEFQKYSELWEARDLTSDAYQYLYRSGLDNMVNNILDKSDVLTDKMEELVGCILEKKGYTNLDSKSRKTIDDIRESIKEDRKRVNDLRELKRNNN